MNSSRTTGQFFTVPESMLKSSGTVWPVALYGRFSFFLCLFLFILFFLPALWWQGTGFTVSGFIHSHVGAVVTNKWFTGM